MQLLLSMAVPYAREEVKQDEKDSEQGGSCQGGCLLERFQQGGKGKSWQGMPQMKELKELTLLVSNEVEKADTAGLPFSEINLTAVSAVFILEGVCRIRSVPKAG
jgi:hypothetical protein